MTTLVFAGQLDSLPKIRDFVAAEARSAGFGDSDVYAVELAVDEACSNIIEHAYRGEGVGDIQCTCRISDDDLTIIIKDHGQPFDPESIPEPNFSASLETLSAGGAGLFLMRKMMDEVKFEFTKDQGNTLTMLKRRD